MILTAYYGFSSRENKCAMPNVVLQQVSSPFAKSNAAKTLYKPIAVSYLKTFVGKEQYAKLFEVFTTGRVYVWGSKLERVHQIEKMKSEPSLILFRRGKRLFGVAAIATLLVNRELAEYLWGTDDYDEPWQIVYLLEEIRSISVDAKEINELIGRKLNDNWQGMTCVTGSRADDVIHFVKTLLASSSRQ